MPRKTLPTDNFHGLQNFRFYYFEEAVSGITHGSTASYSYGGAVAVAVQHATRKHRNKAMIARLTFCVTRISRN